jgi:hypothetical protein
MMMIMMMMMMMMMMKVIIMMQILHRPLLDKLMTSMGERGQSFINFSNQVSCKNFETNVRRCDHDDALT